MESCRQNKFLSICSCFLMPELEEALLVLVKVAMKFKQKASNNLRTDILKCNDINNLVDILKTSDIGEDVACMLKLATL